MNFHLIILTGLILGWAPSVWGESLKTEAVLAPLLFPSTADWLEVTALPRPSGEHLTAVGPELKKALRPLTAEAGWESEEGPLTELIFEHQNCFYLADVNGDGLEDLIYSNFSHYSEGGLHVIWRADGRGGYAIGDDGLNRGYLLRIKPGPDKPLEVTYEPGCCGDFVGVYYQDAPGEARKYRAETFAFYGFDPGRPLLKERIVFNREWTELRGGPEIDDVYDSGRSGGLGYLFMGNVLTIVSDYGRKKLCRGTLVGYDESRQWALVVMDDACRASQEFSVSRGDFIRVGWVRADGFEAAPEEAVLKAAPDSE